MAARRWLLARLGVVSPTDAYLAALAPVELLRPESVTCPVCGMTSHHPADIDEGYCGSCRDWTGTPGGPGG